MRRTLSLPSASVCVASTSRTWLVPMPKAIAPNAPCVEVCESPQAMVMPGWVRPCSGPTTWTMPCLPVGVSKKRDAEALAVLLERDHHLLGERVLERPAGACRSGRCGRRWRTCARGGERRARGSRSMPNACGLVTSWIRCKPMKSCVCPFGSVRTVCASQTLSKRLFAISPLLPPSNPVILSRLAASATWCTATGYRLPVAGKESAMSLR